MPAAGVDEEAPAHGGRRGIVELVVQDAGVGVLGDDAGVGEFRLVLGRAGAQEREVDVEFARTVEPDVPRRQVPAGAHVRGAPHGVEFELVLARAGIVQRIDEAPRIDGVEGRVVAGRPGFADEHRPLAVHQLAEDGRREIVQLGVDLDVELGRGPLRNRFGGRYQ